VLADYLSRYPEVVLDVTLDDRFIDLVEEGFDLALRVEELKDSSLVARRLAPIRFVLCAMVRESAGSRGAPCCLT
jgi:DNA-binding transcriptional LysR family regulator